MLFRLNLALSAQCFLLRVEQNQKVAKEKSLYL